MDINTRFSYKITIVSFWLAICVVFIHANNTSTYQFDLSDTFERSVYIFENWAQGWQQCAVPLFFIISGFLFFRNYTPEKLVSKWKSRCKTLLVPYLIWTHIPWILLSVVKLSPYGNVIGTDASFTFQSWKNFVLLCSGSVLWYVRATMVFVLLSPAIYMVLKKKQLGLLCIFLIIALNTVMLVRNIKIIEELYWIPPYILGAWFAIWKPDFFVNRVNNTNRYIAGIIFVVLLIIAINSKYTLFTPVTQYFYKLALPLPLWFALDIFKFERKPKWHEHLSFPIYCTHAIILETLEKVILVCIGNNIIVALTSYIITPVVVISILIAVFHILNRYFHNLYCIIFGSRG
ncbi:acyltransferase family protein [[Ruminococcus] torques]|uniref:acyltransferase family protein n=1 Tax=[Ruminococcus] torques TaxID=33039 RepID=UPI0025A4AF0E|nr:acyltransferase [[Ruminococcus] torques]MDM8236973.1 acyltransferase [[Ruminococcus] torques]